MLCRSCGTEIAEKALICYRCGVSTAAPAVPRPGARRGGGRRWLIVLAALGGLALVASLLLNQL